MAKHDEVVALLKDYLEAARKKPKLKDENGDPGLQVRSAECNCTVCTCNPCTCANKNRVALVAVPQATTPGAGLFSKEDTVVLEGVKFGLRADGTLEDMGEYPIAAVSAPTSLIGYRVTYAEAGPVVRTVYASDPLATETKLQLSYANPGGYYSFQEGGQYTTSVRTGGPIRRLLQACRERRMERLAGRQNASYARSGVPASVGISYAVPAPTASYSTTFSVPSASYGAPVMDCSSGTCVPAGYTMRRGW